jgi:DNA-binding GntR family transcriptional regulator
MRKLRVPDNLTTLAYKAIKNYIWEGRLDEGARLTEESVSTQLGISKSPVREALNRLESEGLISIEPRRGAYLRTFSIKEIADLYGLREALEVHAVASAQVTADLVDKLRQSVERSRSHLEANDKLRYITEDVHFHSLLALASGNERLAKSLENVQHQVWLFRRKTYDLYGSRAVASHAAIVQALGQGDKVAAQRLMREHISRVCGKLVAYLRERESQPKAATPPQVPNLHSLGSAADQPGGAPTEARAAHEIASGN